MPSPCVLLHGTPGLIVLASSLWWQSAGYPASLSTHAQSHRHMPNGVMCTSPTGDGGRHNRQGVPPGPLRLQDIVPWRRCRRPDRLHHPVRVRGREPARLSFGRIFLRCCLLRWPNLVGCVILFACLSPCTPQHARPTAFHQLESQQLESSCWSPLTCVERRHPALCLAASLRTQRLDSRGCGRRASLPEELHACMLQNTLQNRTYSERLVFAGWVRRWRSRKSTSKSAETVYNHTATGTYSGESVWVSGSVHQATLRRGV